MKENLSTASELINLKKQFALLEKRLSDVELSLKNLKLNKNISEIGIIDESADDFELKLPFKSKESIEFRVGEYGMAWLGNIVLFLGITFLVQYLQNSGNLLFSSFIGFASVAGIYAGSHFTRNSFSFLSKLFLYNGHILLFYVTLQLHFFQADPLINNKVLGIALLLIVTGVLYYKSFRRKSQFLSGLVLLMVMVTGVISKSNHFTALLTTVAAVLSIIYYYKFGWTKLVFIFISLIYLVHLNWLTNNAFAGNRLGFIESPGLNYIYVFVTGFTLSLLALLPKKDEVINSSIVSSVIWNGLGFTSILLLITTTYFEESYVPIFVTITIFCMIYSVILQTRSIVKITASMYALYGFLAMSVAFYGIFGLPKAYMLLSIQSLLVVSMALWFRSQFIVIMNLFLFVILMVFYLKAPDDYNTTNFSFMLVAFITARVLDWKKERLKIKTEYLRNIYLISGYIMTLIFLYHAVPASNITVSWIFAAILFFILSLVMKNIKYRWLAISIMVASAIKLIFIDMSNIDMVYRILVFLLLAIISITISILYTKFFMKKKEE